DLGITQDELSGHYNDEYSLVEAILQFEHNSLQSLFESTSFENGNAIDGLLKVSKQLSQRFINIIPSFNFSIKNDFPDLHQQYFRLRNEFVFDKISRNIEDGINEGLYRPDLSVELVSRIYISRLIDLYNPDFFPPAQFSFNTLFEVMFDTFIRGIATDDGVKYFEKKVKCLKFPDEG
ncbi:MAG TPA: hypothetical protein PLP88_06485, partial [Bacteroidales bacterium]|nr:hypothetical protein [Bacteroidales bacterium]